jgi:hypothetical protein
VKNSYVLDSIISIPRMVPAFYGSIACTPPFLTPARFSTTIQPEFKASDLFMQLVSPPISTLRRRLSHSKSSFPLASPIRYRNPRWQHWRWWRIFQDIRFISSDASSRRDCPCWLCFKRAALPSSRRFQHEMRVFAYINFAFWSAGFRFQRIVLPLPSKQSLCSTFGPDVQKFESFLTSREVIRRLIQNYIESYSNPPTPLLSTLAIDAFAVQPFASPELNKTNTSIMADKVDRSEGLHHKSWCCFIHSICSFAGSWSIDHRWLSRIAP